jgi:hypothetical protein
MSISGAPKFDAFMTEWENAYGTAVLHTSLRPDDGLDRDSFIQRLAEVLAQAAISGLVSDVHAWSEGKLMVEIRTKDTDDDEVMRFMAGVTALYPAQIDGETANEWTGEFAAAYNARDRAAMDRLWSSVKDAAVR